MTPNDFRKLVSEFEAFSSASVSPASAVPVEITRRIRSDLTTDRIRTHARLLLIHILAASVSITLCGQFGLTIMGSSAGLSVTFMSFGPVVCMIGCGFFFMGVSLLAGTILLKPFEVLTIRRHRLLEIGAISVLSLGFFALFGVHQIHIGAAWAWLFGAIVGGITTLELGWVFHCWAHRHHK